ATSKLPFSRRKAVEPKSPSRQSISPGFSRRRSTLPAFHSRNLYETPANSGCCLSSAALIGREWPDSAGISECTGARKVRAAVGQEIMHSPHETQFDFPIGTLRSKPIRV